MYRTERIWIPQTNYSKTIRNLPTLLLTRSKLITTVSNLLAGSQFFFPQGTLSQGRTHENHHRSFPIISLFPREKSSPPCCTKKRTRNRWKSECGAFQKDSEGKTKTERERESSLLCLVRTGESRILCNLVEDDRGPSGGCRWDPEV